MTYRGRATRSGNSKAIAFEAALYRTHPEFESGRFKADYIGPGTLLIRAASDTKDDPSEQDPVLAAFLAFLEHDMGKHPERIQPLPPELIARAENLVGHIEVDWDEDMGEEDVALP